jgi:hypothetical protein
VSFPGEEALVHRLDELRHLLDVAAPEGVTRGDLMGLRLLIDERHESQLRAFDRAYATQEKRMEAAAIATEKAVDRASVNLEKRLEAMNEIRGSLADVLATSATRSEVTQMVTSLTEKLTAETAWTAARLVETNARIDSTTSRLDITQGAQTSANSIRTWQMALAMIFLVTVSTAVTILTRYA